MPTRRESGEETVWRPTPEWLMSRRHVMRLVLIAASLFFFSCKSGDKQAERSPEELVVAAAADLAPAFQEIGPIFERATGIGVVFNFGSSGMLARQIENGAPMDVFAAANIDFLDGLGRLGLIIPDTRTLYARGRITIWTRQDSPLRIDKLEDLTRRDVRKVAIANPAHAPYGAAAKQALQSAGVWDQVQGKCVFGEDVRQTLQYAATDNVDVAIVALSLSVQSDGRWTLIPAELHRPLDQALAVLRSTPQEEHARRFTAFINGSQGRPIMRKYGFILPGEETAR